VSDDPLWDDLGYPPPRVDPWAQLDEAVRRLTVTLDMFGAVIALPPDELKDDPAPDWR
jgi:hypothetical protein